MPILYSRLVPRLRFAVHNLQRNKEFYMQMIQEEGKKRASEGKPIDEKGSSKDVGIKKKMKK